MIIIYLISLKSGTEATSCRFTGSVYLTPFLTYNMFRLRFNYLDTNYQLEMQYKTNLLSHDAPQ